MLYMREIGTKRLKLKALRDAQRRKCLAANHVFSIYYIYESTFEAINRFFMDQADRSDEANNTFGHYVIKPTPENMAFLRSLHNDYYGGPPGAGFTFEGILAMEK